MNPSAADAIPPHLFKNTLFNNVMPGAMAYIKSPSGGWSSLADCVGFPCTAPLNILFDFDKTRYNIGSKLNHGR